MQIYIRDKYGLGYTVYETKTLSGYTYVSQYDLSLYYPSKDSFYKKYNYKCDYYIPYSKSMPRLYLDVRNVAILKHGYEVSGTNSFNISGNIKEVGIKYGYKFNPKHVLVWSYNCCNRI